MSENESMTDAQRTAWLHKHCEPGCTLVYESCGVRLSVTKSADVDKLLELGRERLQTDFDGPDFVPSPQTLETSPVFTSMCEGGGTYSCPGYRGFCGRCASEASEASRSYQTREQT